MTPLESYLTELRVIHSSGASVKEASGYGPLATLLNEIGKTLKPKVHCIIQLQNSGAGMPDGGLFTPDQLKNCDEGAPLRGQKPARGVIEVKGPGEDLAQLAQTSQVLGYLNNYGQVLITNYRDFRLLKRGPGGDMELLEAFRLAEDEPAFWTAASHPRKTADTFGERFSEYLKRVLLHAAPLDNPKDVAFFLASYARDARARVEHAGDLPALTAVRTALEEALGMKFEAAQGEHFFRSTLVQTLFYGVFSAWVLWHKEKPQRRDAFDWKAAAWTLHVPMIKALFEQVATPTKLGPLGLVEVLDWTAAALNRIDRLAFFEKFLETYAVQYFYEPFLEAFDPKLRKELGVWYTPPEIVQYQVARVDTVLREELDIPDGLADPRVFVLDPCCGTGAYLVEVLRKIVHTIKVEKSEGALAELAAKEAAQNRVLGFEIMPAPFVVAHLQIGLLLQTFAVPLDDSKHERAGIFLTNSLTGWDFSGANPKLANWPELESERKGAGKVKQEKPILVILGNPPYNAYAGISPDEEQGMVEPYKAGLVKDWGIKKFNLDDLYVRFFRLAERRIAEKTGKGVVCYISNHSWISDPSFVVLRQHLLNSFDRLWIENMHGNRKISEYAPDGRTSETIFALAGSSPGIQQGVAISLWVKTGKNRKPTVFFRDDLNDAKAADRRAKLLDSLEVKNFNAQYEKSQPKKENRFSLRPSDIAEYYLDWAALVDLCAEPPINGLMEKRGGALIDIDRAALEKRMKLYYDPTTSWDSLVNVNTGLTQDAARFNAKSAREKVLKAEGYQPNHLQRYALRPFDTRWCYYSSERPLWNEPRPKLWAQNWNGNAFLMCRPAGVASPEGFPLFYTTLLGDNDFLRGHAYYFPLGLRSEAKNKTKEPDDGNGELSYILQEAASADSVEIKTTANLSTAARGYLANLGIKNPDADTDVASLLWMHALAIGFSPSYLTENTDGIRQDWPRIPLPNSKAALIASARLGRQIAALLDAETTVEGVNAGKLRNELKSIAVLSSSENLSLSAGWGHAGKEGVTMPGKGKRLTRDYRMDENNGKTFLLGATTHDIYLNDTAYWRNVPAKVWDYTIGGYQVMKKWLSYREFALLKRPLTVDEAREVTHIARRLAALLLLQPALDTNYQTVKAASMPLPK
ncbi:MAG: type ISP restriction/modification enzyme [Verrucomicrobiota bacterium]